MSSFLGEFGQQVAVLPRHPFEDVVGSVGGVVESAFERDVAFGEGFFVAHFCCGRGLGLCGRVDQMGRGFLIVVCRCVRKYQMPL